ncbi:MAG: histidine kinase, partial [Algoriella sp.]
KKFEKTFSEYSYNRNEWESFELNIQEIHQDFIKRLSDKYSQLSAKDLKLCVFLRMNLSTKEIAPLMHLNYRSVELQRYRLRKKMQISSEINLNKYMINF